MPNLRRLQPRSCGLPRRLGSLALVHLRQHPMRTYDLYHDYVQQLMLLLLHSHGYHRQIAMSRLEQVSSHSSPIRGQSPTSNVILALSPSMLDRTSLKPHQPLTCRLREMISCRDPMTRVEVTREDRKITALRKTMISRMIILLACRACLNFRTTLQAPKKPFRRRMRSSSHPAIRLMPIPTTS